jgi:ABC-2 type transport system permease protein
MAPTKKVRMSPLFLSSTTLLIRELVRFFRQRNRVIGAFASPLILWILMGQGLSSSFRPSFMAPGTSAMEYLFPGTMTLIILFTSIFSTISIIEDRREGFLQGVLVAPIPRAGIVLGKILGGTVIASLQAMVFLLLAPTVGISISVASFLSAMGVVVLLGFVLTGLGFAIAWRMDSTQGFHAIMNLFLIPMWLLSGSFFPSEGAPFWLGLLMKLNPLTYGVAALRRALYSAGSNSLEYLPPLSSALMVTVIFGIVFFVLCLMLVKMPRKHHV